MPTAIYADPPYLRKGASYLHDFEEPDHKRLAKVLARFTEGRVVVSYYDAPELEELYPGWERIECAVPSHPQQFPHIYAHALANRRSVFLIVEPGESEELKVKAEVAPLQ